MFISPMCVVPIGRDKSDKTIWEQRSKDMVWDDDKYTVIIKPGFQTDFCSVVRLPWIYSIWGDRAHSEGALHDYTYRKDCLIYVKAEKRWVVGMPRKEADDLFLRAILSRGHSKGIAYPMWAAVRLFGGAHYCKLTVAHKFPLAVTFPEAVA